MSDIRLSSYSFYGENSLAKFMGFLVTTIFYFYWANLGSARYVTYHFSNRCTGILLNMTNIAITNLQFKAEK